MREPETRKKRAANERRVSHRRELAVVTLAAVASISGVGGLLAVNPPASQSAQPAGAREQPALAAPARPDDQTDGLLPTSSNGGYRGDDEYYEDDEGEQAAVQPASTLPTRKAAPSWSAPSQAPASAVSQGS